MEFLSNAAAMLLGLPAALKLKTTTSLTQRRHDGEGGTTTSSVEIRKHTAARMQAPPRGHRHRQQQHLNQQPHRRWHASTTTATPPLKQAALKRAATPLLAHKHHNGHTGLSINSVETTNRNADHTLPTPLLTRTMQQEGSAAAPPRHHLYFKQHQLFYIHKEDAWHVLFVYTANVFMQISLPCIPALPHRSQASSCQSVARHAVQHPTDQWCTLCVNGCVHMLPLFSHVLAPLVSLSYQSL